MASSSNETTLVETSTETVYIVLQHSGSAGNSALLPVSTVKGIFRTRQEARSFLQRAKHEEHPLTRDLGGPGLPRFWNTSTAADMDGDGCKYTAANGEDFVLWIEEHEVAAPGTIQESV